MIKKIIRQIRTLAQKSFLGYESEVLTFSQAGEDLVVRNFFYDRLSRGGKGFFVDIGAYHPYRHSNTYYLYRAGWRGLNIDARPGSMKLFNKLRPEDINLEVAVGETEGVSKYYDFGDKDSALNTTSEKYIEKLGMSERVQKEHAVETKTLSTIFDLYLPRKLEIDFLSIDIEGLEEKVLPTNDWSRYSPTLLACEIYGDSLAEIADAPVSNLLVANGYQIFARLNLAMPKVNTVFFVRSRK